MKQVDFICQPTRIKHEFFTDIVDCSIGYTHGAFINSSGEIILSGSNSAGQLGMPSSDKSVPQRHVIKMNSMNSELGNVAAVSCGDYFTTTVTESGKIFSWGRSAKGRLGRTGESDVINRPGEVTIRRELVLDQLSHSVKVQCSHDSTMLLLQGRDSFEHDSESK